MDRILILLVFMKKSEIRFFEFDNDFVVLCGDLNIVINSSIDTFNSSHINNPKARNKVLDIMEDLQMFEYYRIFYPENKIYTWKKKKSLENSLF